MRLYPSSVIKGHSVPVKVAVKSNYDGWLLLEARADVKPHEVPEKLKHQKAVFDKYVAMAQQ